MFGPSTDEILKIVVHAKDEAFQISLGAMREAHEMVLAAKEVEVDVLRRQVQDLTSQLKYEQARADALCDRLLVRDAKVAAVAPTAVAAATERDEEAYKKLKETFEQLNDVGVAPAAVAEARAFEMAGGGSAVAHRG